MLTDATMYGLNGARSCTDRINARRLLDGAAPVVLPDDDQQTTDLLPVYANHGRWVVDCPCGSAQLASRDDPRFFCSECLNAWALGKWVGLEWPSAHEEIEGLLMQRPDIRTQNWNPSESVLALAIENADRGVGA